MTRTRTEEDTSLPGFGRGGRRVRWLWAAHLGTLLCLALLRTVAAEADVPAAQAVEVQHLLGYLAESECRMVRNGKSHSGAEGARHVQRKYDHYREEIGSTEQFIELAATKSLRTGLPYEVHCPGDPPVPSAEWLQDQLDRFRLSQ